MQLFKLRCAQGATPIEQINEDYNKAVKIGQYRLGQEAIFYPGFPGPWYLPFASVTKALTRNTSLPLTGCCGKALPMVRLRLYYGNQEGFMDFMFEKPEEANRALDQLLASHPDVPYERETRPLSAL